MHLKILEICVMKNMGSIFDPNFLSALVLAWQVALRNIKVKLDLYTDIY